jgi:uncharacterized protein
MHDFGEVKQLLITGATGFIGRTLVRAAQASGVQVAVLSRDPEQARKILGAVTAHQSADELSANAQFDAIVHLAGANVIAWPWSAARKNVLMSSRIRIAEQLLSFVARAKKPPKTWVQASAVGYYSTQAPSAIDESAEVGTGFAAELCQAIEAKAMAAAQFGLRVVNLRIGVVLGKGGGVYPMMRAATFIGGGAVLAGGAQHFAWVHLDDVVAMLARAGFDTNWRGAVNAVAPDAPTNKQFAETLAKQLHRPMLWRIPAFALRPVLGQRAPLLLAGAKIKPTKLLALDYKFRFPTLASALAEIG